MDAREVALELTRLYIENFKLDLKGKSNEDQVVAFAEIYRSILKTISKPIT
ncbi:MAG: hypothetical protein LBU47_01915 [Christensenellaceae bacterium]|jgi:hypothetical protein|nr:hypothetical protein [Christensenellaceae bacterium]